MGSSWPWSYCSWIYNYLSNQRLSPLMLWVQILIRVRCTTLCDKVCQWLATGRWFSPGPPVLSTNKTDCHDITEILLMTLNTIEQTSILKVFPFILETWKSPLDFFFSNILYHQICIHSLFILFVNIYFEIFPNSMKNII